MESIPEDGEMIVPAGIKTSGKFDRSAPGDEGTAAPDPTPFSSLAHGSVQQHLHRNTVVAQPGDSLVKDP